MEQILEKLVDDFEQGKLSRRQLIRSLAIATTAACGMGATPEPAAAQTPLRAVSVEHITLDVRDPKKVQNWYADMFGLTRVPDAKGINKNHVRIGDTFLTIGIDDVYQESQAMRNQNKCAQPRIDHFAIAVEPWQDKSDNSIKGAGPKIEAELRRRGFKINPTGPVNVTDPEGMAVQLVASGYLGRKVENFK